MPRGSREDPYAMLRKHGEEYILSPKVPGTLPLELKLYAGDIIKTERALTITKATLLETIHRLKKAHPTAHRTLYALELSLYYLRHVKLTDRDVFEMAPGSAHSP